MRESYNIKWGVEGINQEPVKYTSKFYRQQDRDEEEEDKEDGECSEDKNAEKSNFEGGKGSSVSTLGQKGRSINSQYQKRFEDNQRKVTDTTIEKERGQEEEGVEKQQ